MSDTTKAGYIKQISKDRYYLSIAQAVALKSTCRRRHYGAVIVKNDEILSTGYNGSPRDCVNCTDMGICMRDVANVEKGKGYNLCLSVHAEMNAIISAARRDMIGSTLYIVGIEIDGRYANPSPCLLCHRLIINAGISRVVGLQRRNDDIPNPNGPIPNSLEADVVTMDITSTSFQKRIYDEEYRPLYDNEADIPEPIRILKFASQVKEIRMSMGMTRIPDLVRMGNGELVMETMVSPQKETNSHDQHTDDT